MQSHQRNLRPLIVGVGVTHQRSVVQKLVESFAAIFRIHRRVDQFVQILNPRISLRSVLGFELLNITRAVNQEFQKLSRVRGGSRSTKSCNWRWLAFAFAFIRATTRSPYVLSSPKITRP